MAIYRFSFKHGSKSKGRSAGAHAQYILRLGKYKYNSHHFKHGESGNMPHWAESAVDFWKASDEYERDNAKVYSEFEIALPRELTDKQNLELIRGFIREELGDKHAYTFAVHESNAADGGTNPHVHVMFCTRAMDEHFRERELFFKRANPDKPELGGAKKDRSWKPKERLISLRKSWEKHCNDALASAGVKELVNHMSHKDRGINRKPEPKLRQYEAALWNQGVTESDRAKEILLIREQAKAEG